MYCSPYQLEKANLRSSGTLSLVKIQSCVLKQLQQPCTLSGKSSYRHIQCLLEMIDMSYTKPLWQYFSEILSKVVKDWALLSKDQ